MTQAVPIQTLTADIAIIGGGMVGLTLALILAKQLPSRHICLIEAHSLPLAADAQLHQPSFDARSTAISAGSVDIFKHLGIWASLTRHITEITEVHVSDKGHFGRTSYSKSSGRHGVNSQADLGYVIENAWLGKQLLHAARNRANIEIIDDTQVTSVSFEKNCANIHLRLNDKAKGSRVVLGSRVENDAALLLSVELAILADGANSQLATALGIDTSTLPYQQHAIIANVQYDKNHHGRAFERFTAEGPMALLPLGESANAKTSALVWTQPSDAVAHALALSDADFLARIQQAFGFRLGFFTAVSQRHSYELSLKQASEQVRSSLVLMGNAAHFLHPVAGQGFNLALRDCAALAHQLQVAQAQQKSMGDLTTLLAYQTMQAHDQHLTTQISHQFNRIFSHQHKVAQAGRNVGLLTLDMARPAKHHFFQQMMGLGGRRYL